MLIATLRLQDCLSSSGDEVDCLRAAICNTLVRCYWCISILIVFPRNCTRRWTEAFLRQLQLFPKDS